MKTIGKIFKLLVFVTWFAGWGLAAASLHVVRTPDKVVVVPKDRLTFNETYADIREWTTDDVASHPQLTARLTATGRSDLLANVPVKTVENELKKATESSESHNSSLLSHPTTTPAVQSKSIFD